MAKAIPVAELAARVREGSRTHLARAITLVESSRPDHRAQARELLKLLTPYAGNSIRLGISGVPGAGKSTFTNALGVELIERGHRVAVLAVDPSSSRTGGSILGDRTRMSDLAATTDAFIRPSPSGNHLGGVARATRESMILVEAAGFDVVIVETVGVGQSEVAVSEMVDTFLLLALARAGDQLQGIKRGILEIADVIAINKADGEHVADARVAAREMSIAMKLISSDTDARRPDVLTCSALTKDGLTDVWNAVLQHRAYLEDKHGLAARRTQQQVQWLWAMVQSELWNSFRASRPVRDLAVEVEHGIRAQELSAMEGAQQLLFTFAQDVPNLTWAQAPAEQPAE